VVELLPAAAVDDDDVTEAVPSADDVTGTCAADDVALEVEFEEGDPLTTLVATSLAPPEIVVPPFMAADDANGGSNLVG